MSNISRLILPRLVAFDFKCNKFQPFCIINFLHTYQQSQQVLNLWKYNRNLFNMNKILMTNIKRYKYKKTTKKEYDDSDSDEEDNQFQEERDSKVIKTLVSSLRADTILKSGLNIARNKVELAFYESRIRINGEKIPKKSVQVYIGDEIDLIKGFSNINPAHLTISRVIVLDAVGKENGITAHLRRYKNLTIENYTGQNAWKSDS